MYHIVQKTFTGQGVQRLPGEAVDAAKWPTLPRLISQRLLGHVQVAEPTACPCGRLWAAEPAPHACKKPKIGAAAAATESHR